MEVSFFDTVELGTSGEDGTKPARLSFTPSMYWGVKGALGLNLETTRLHLKVGAKTLCDGAFAQVGRGRICAIMGPSGCGKSIFLETLAGLRRPDAGRVFLADAKQRIEPYREGSANYVAFVPQADVMIGELTVAASLQSRIHLIYPGVTARVRDRIVDSIGDSLGFQGDRLGKFLSTRIGSPEIRSAVLSGGERRRASVGHELVANPMALLLDEPTSGLSSVDAYDVVQFLKRVGQNYRIPIVVSIHQPADELFALFDDLLVMALGSGVLYHGPAEGGASLLSRWVGEGVEEGAFGREEAERVAALDTQSAEFFLKVQESAEVRDYLVRRFSAASSEGLVGVYHPALEASPAQTVRLGEGRGNPVGRMAWGTERFVRTTWELIERSLTTLRADTMSVRFMLLQAPLLAILVCLAFSMGREKLFRDDVFARTIYWGKQISEKERGDRSLPQLFRDANQKAKEDVVHLGEGHARLEATVLFVLAFAILWLSTVGAAKEVVHDYGVIFQEYRAGIGIVPVILSRFLVLTAVSAVQAMLLLAVVGLMLLKTHNLAWYIDAWEALTLCGALSTAVGLMVSACSGTYRLALAIVPLITIPQVLFSGVLQTVPIAVNSMVQHILGILPLRMAWEGLLQVSAFWTSGIIILEGQEVSGRIGAMSIAENMVTAHVRGFRDVYFGGHDWGATVSAIMLLECAVILGFTIGVLRMRVRRGIR